MHDLGRRARQRLADARQAGRHAPSGGGMRGSVADWPYALRAVLVTGAVQLLVVITGTAGPPHAYQVALALVAAAALGLAAAVQLRVGPPGAPELTDPVLQARAVADALRRKAEQSRRGRDAAGTTDDELEQRWAAHVQGVDERWRTGGYPATEEAHPVSTVEEPVPPPARPGPPEPARQPGPSRLRIALVVVASVTLAGLLWLPIGPAGPVAVSVATFLFGYAGYALPLLPPLALRLLPPSPRESVPWHLLFQRRRPARADLGVVVVCALAAAWEHVLTRALGCVLALLGLLHLLRDAPGFDEGGYRRAGGLVGMLVAAPLGWVFSTSGAIGLLCALIVSVALAGAAWLLRYRGRDWAIGGLVVLLAVPLGAAVVGRFFGYDYNLGTQGDRVVVMAGVTHHARHAIRDAGVSTRDVPISARPLLATGIPIADDDEGVRLARAMVRPAAVKTFPSDAGDLTAGQCFNSAGPQARLRYPTTCEAAHFGEVYFVARLPYDRDPGADVVAATSRALCERAYSDYLLVPFGQSFLPIEAPLTVPGAWTPEPVVACWFRSIGTASLHSSRILASLYQNTSWDAGPGCRAAIADRLTLSADKAGTCVAPGRSSSESVPLGTVNIEASIATVGSYPGTSRIGVACVDGDATNGYYVAVSPAGAIEIWRMAGGTRLDLSGVNPKRAAPVRPDTAFDLHVSCALLPNGGGVTVAASTAAASARVTDASSPVTRLSARVFAQTQEAVPLAMTVTAFTATLS